MILTTKGKYAVLAMIDMCINHEQKPVSLASIAKRNNLSISYLEQIFFYSKKMTLFVLLKALVEDMFLLKILKKLKFLR